MDLIELLIGDDTRAGVRATFWLDTSSSRTPSTSVCPRRKVLEGARAGDVLLLRRMAVAAWKGVVYVQSRGWGGGTQVERVDVGRDVGACGAEFGERLERVREWVGMFVGRAGRKRMQGDGGERREERGGKRVRREGETEDLPPDTQETGAG